MTASDLQRWDAFIALFCGQSGHGKTIAIASLAKKYLAIKKRLLILDIDKRARGILGLASLLGPEVMNNIEIQQDYTVKEGFTGLEKSLEMLIIKQQNPSTADRKSTRLNSSHIQKSRMPSSA